MTFHAYVEGFETFAQDPCIKWRKCGPSTTTKSINISDKIFSSHNDASKHSSLSVEPFSSRMHYKVCTKFNRLLSDRSSKTIVHIQNYIIFFCQRRNFLQVNYIQTRVGRRFQINHFSIWSDSSFP